MPVLCSWHCLGCWGYACEQNRPKKSLLLWSLSSVRKKSEKIKGKKVWRGGVAVLIGVDRVALTEKVIYVIRVKGNKEERHADI